MKDRLLGTPPDQILESEKLRRLQDISDREIAHSKTFTPTSDVDASIKHMQERIEFIKEEQELDRRYPGMPNTFIDQCLTGEASIDDIDYFVNTWHSGSSIGELSDFLGMTKEEYASWVEHPETLDHILSTRKLL